MSGIDWPRNSPAAPPPQRLFYKQRLGWMRQEVVCDGFMYTTSSGVRLWKTRRNADFAEAGIAGTRSPELRGGRACRRRLIRTGGRLRGNRWEKITGQISPRGETADGWDQAALRSWKASRITSFSPSSPTSPIAMATGNHLRRRWPFSGQMSFSSTSRSR